MTTTALAHLGMDFEATVDRTAPNGAAPAAGPAVTPLHRAAQDNVPAGSVPLSSDRLDHFVERDGMKFAGTHLIVDLWDGSQLDDLGHVDATLRRATEAAGATLLNIDLHHFTPNNGISGVAVLAESHISIHTWPECGYAAIDIFMCGDAQPHKAIAVLREAFAAGRVSVAEHKRGIVA